MRDVKNQDERVLAQRRKIQSDGFQLLIYILLFSVLVQQIFLQAPVSQYMVELVCLILAGFYNLVRNFNVGINLFGDDNNFGKNLFKNAVISGVGSIIFSVILTGERDVLNILSYGIMYGLMFGGMTYFMYYVSRKKQDKIKKELDIDEDDID